MQHLALQVGDHDAVAGRLQRLHQQPFLVLQAVPGGRLVFYGATLGNATNVLVRRIFWKQLNVLGSTMGSPADFAAMTAFVASYGLRPVVDSVFSPLEGAAAFARMEEGGQFGKIVVKMR